MRGRVPIQAAAACILLAAVVATASSTSRAAAVPDRPTKAGVPEAVSRGVTETVDQIMARDLAVSGTAEVQSVPQMEFDPGKTFDPAAPVAAQWPLASPLPPELTASLAPFVTGTSFKTIGQTESGFIPPDTAGDVGPTQILAHVNGRIRVFAKSGAPGSLNATGLSFWASVTNGSQPIFPQVRYDRLSGRWILLAVNSTKPNNRVLIAVQTTPGTITGSSSFTFYQFDQGSGGGGGDTTDYCEAPKLGIDANALYIGCNMITIFGVLDRTTVYVVRKSSIIPGPGPLVVTAFRDISNGTAGPGPFAPTGVDNDDAQGTSGYFIGVDIGTSGLLQIRKVSDPGGSPTLSGNLPLTVLATAPPISQPASGSTTNLDAGDNRLSRASLRKNKLTGVTTLWTSHGSEVDASCAAVAGGGRNGARWYEIAGSSPAPGDPLGGAPTLVQSGTLCDPSPTDPQGYLYPSIVATGQGSMSMGCSFASPNLFAGAAASGRSRLDPAGSTQPATTLQSGLASYTFVANGRNRWGDYSFTGVDPNDDQTAWTFQEYADTTRNTWAIRAVQLKSPPPPTVTGLQGVVCAGHPPTVALTVTGTANSPVAGAEFFDPGADAGGPGFAGHLTATVTGGVTINGTPSLVLPVNPSTQPALQVTLSLNTTNATSGLKNITIKNADAQATTGVGVLRVDQIFTPAAANNGPVCAGGTLQLSVPAAAGATYSWSGPNGFSSSLQNPTIPNVTLNVAGTYTVTISGTGCPLPSGSTTVQVLAESAPCQDGNACTTGDTCVAGACQAGVAVVCNDNNVCTADSCNPASGCVFTDTTAIQCDDGDVCTNDLCDPVSGCFHANNNAPCNDGNPCTTGDTCAGGTCQPGAPTDCGDANACTADGCDPATGCVHTDVSPACNDGNVCTNDGCNPATGCVFTNNAAPCNDGNACTAGDTCGGGSCQPGAATNCSDGNPCTDDGCNQTTGCVYSNNAAPCEDGNACTTGDVCFHRSCKPGTSVVCNDNNVCTLDSCNPAIGCVFTDNSATCNDGNACTADTCDPVAGCVHTDVSAACDDNNVCTDDSCDPAVGCVHAANTSACEDGNPCTSSDTCGSGTCHPGIATVCNDHNACTHDACDPATGCVFIDNSASCNDDNICTDETCDPAVGCVYVYNSGPCDDGDICTIDDFCFEGGCTSITDLPCDDQNPCTTDSCVPPSGCVHAYDPEVQCDDNDVCTTDDCDPVTGCHYSPSTAPCNDGNPCTLGDTCGGGSCQPGTGTLDCNDNNPCTNDSCNPLTGCIYTNNSSPCNDGNACTAGDFCSHRNCQPGTPVVCNDNNVCTSDSCNPATGCVFVDTSAACNDGDVCTDDRCDPLTGCVFTNNTAPCDDGNVCTGGDTCHAGACAGVPGPPPEVGGVTAAGHSPTTLSWLETAGGGAYDIASSTIAGLHAMGTSGAMCLANDVTGSSFADPQADPPEHGGYYYLLRVQNQCGTGSYGFSSSSTERVPSAACP